MHSFRFKAGSCSHFGRILYRCWVWVEDLRYLAQEFCDPFRFHGGLPVNTSFHHRVLSCKKFLLQPPILCLTSGVVKQVYTAGISIPMYIKESEENKKRNDALQQRKAQLNEKLQSGKGSKGAKTERWVWLYMQTIKTGFFAVMWWWPLIRRRWHGNKLIITYLSQAATDDFCMM